MYTHRGAYLHTLGVIAEAQLDTRTAYLWTLPMFHCHGWAFTWAVTAMGGEHRCLARFDAGRVWAMLAAGEVSHLCGAPTVLTMLAADPAATPAAAAGEGVRGRRAAVTRAAARGRGAGHAGHPPLRPDRDLRADRRVRLAAGVG